MLKPLTKNNRNTIKMTKNLPSYQEENMGTRIHGMRYNIKDKDSKMKEVADTYQLDHQISGDKSEDDKHYANGVSGKNQFY